MSRAAFYIDQAQRKAALAKAAAFVSSQATRLRVTEATVLHAIACRMFPDEIENLSPLAFATELSGRSTTPPRDLTYLASLKKMRAHFAKHDEAEGLHGSLAGKIAEQNRDLESQRRQEKYNKRNRAA